MLQFLSFLILPLPSQCPIPPPKPTTKLRVLLGPVPTMSSASSSSSAFRPACNATVPSLGVDETGAVADETFRGYTTPNLRRGGARVAIVWFRNDLRVLDRAASDAILPVYCVDSWIFAGSTHYFGFPKTGGENIGHWLASCCIWDWLIGGSRGVLQFLAPAKLDAS